MQDQNTPMEQDELMDAADLYTLVDEEGNEKLFELIDVLEENGQVYFALIPHIENPAELLDGEVEHCKEGDFVWVECGTSHELHAKTDVRMMTIGCLAESADNAEK